MCKVKVFAPMFVYTSFPLIFLCNTPIFRKKSFVILTQPQGLRVSLRKEYGWCSVFHSLQFDMQHDYFLSKRKFWPFDPTPAYATWPCYEKIEFWPLPHPLSPPKGPDPGLWTKFPFDRFHIYLTSVCKRNFSQNIDNWPSYCENLIFDLWPRQRGQGGRVKFYHCHAYL